MQISAENHLTRLWHTDCPDWMPESRHGQNTSAIMRYVIPQQTTEHTDGSTLYLAECLHCGAKGYIGLDAKRAVVVKEFGDFGLLPKEIDVDEQREHIEQFFAYAHLPLSLQEVSKPFAELAKTVLTLPRNAERTVALRKLLEAKDAAVRAKVAV